MKGFAQRFQHDMLKRPDKVSHPLARPNRNGSLGDHVMASKPLPPLAVLRQLFDYNPATGHLVWREQPLSWFPDARAAKSWNRLCAGEIAGSRDPRGYVVIRIKQQRFYAHRIIWSLISGNEVTLDVDHINGDRSDNRASNLRQCSNEDNSKNSKLNANNTSGICGVTWDKKNNKWKAYGRSSGRMHNLGRFDTIEDAAKARKEFEANNGFFAGHGKRR